MLTEVEAERALVNIGKDATAKSAMQATIKNLILDESCMFVISALLSNNPTFMRRQASEFRFRYGQVPFTV